MASWPAEQLPEDVLSQWDAWIRAGERTYAEMATALGLPSGNAARKRLQRWRARVVRAVPEQAGWSEAPPGQEREVLLSRLLDALVQTQETLAALDDRQPELTLTLPDAAPVLLVLFSDTHIGGTGVDHKQMQADMELVRDTPGAYAVHLGDHVDNFSPKVLPSGMLEQLAAPDLQWELAELFLRRHLTPKKLLAGVQGNHDAFSGAAGLNPCREMYRRLGVPYLGPGGRVWLKLGSQTYKLELRHDFPYKSSLNSTNSQRRLAEITMGADVVAVGHTHFPDLQYVWRGTSNQIYLRASTYKRHDGYAEAKGFQFGYAPPPPDMPGVIFFPDSHRMIPFRRFQDGVPYLKMLRQD